MAESALTRLERIVAEAEAFESAGPRDTVTITLELAKGVVDEARRLAMVCRVSHDGRHRWVPWREDGDGVVSICSLCSFTVRLAKERLLAK